MRRMITNKQIDDIEQGAELNKYISYSDPILPLPQISNEVIFNQYVDDFAKSVENGDYAVDFTNHHITEWYPSLEDEQHICTCSFDFLKAIDFPKDINTVEDLAAWIKENWQSFIYQAVKDECIYMDGGNSLNPAWDISPDVYSARYESDGIHVPLDEPVVYNQRYLESLKLYLDPSKNTYVNAMGQIYSNQKFTTTNTVIAHSGEFSNIVKAAEIKSSTNNKLKIGPSEFTAPLELNKEDLVIQNGSTPAEHGLIFKVNNNNSAKVTYKYTGTGTFQNRLYIKVEELAGAGLIILEGVPTADPHVAGAIWNDNGVLKISAGQ